MGADAPILPNTMKVADPQKERPLTVSSAVFMSAITKNILPGEAPTVRPGDSTGYGTHQKRNLITDNISNPHAIARRIFYASVILLY